MGIAQKIGAIFTSLLIIAAVNVFLVEDMITVSKRMTDTVNVAGKLRMLAQRVAVQTLSHGQGGSAGEVEVRQLMRDFEAAMDALTNGGYVFGVRLAALPAEHAPRLADVTDQWTSLERSVLKVLAIMAWYQNEATVPHVGWTPYGDLSPLPDEVAGHSARLLERTEALMDGIVADVQATQGASLSRVYQLLALNGLLIFLAFMAVRRRIAAPLRDLATHWQELARGNYNTRFEISARDEIGLLARVFNESAKRIGALIERIEQERLDLKQAETMFRGIAENSMVGVYIAHKGRFRYVNAKMAEIFGYARGEMVDEIPSTAVFPGTLPETLGDSATRQRLVGNAPGLWVERTGRRKDGSSIDVEVFGSLMTLGDDLVTVGIALDITHRKELEAQAKLAMVVHRHSSDAMVVTHPDGRLISVNPAFTRITGYQPEEVIGKRLNVLSSGRHDASFYRKMWSALQQTGSWEGDIWNRRKNGEIYAERLIINTSYDDDGEPRYRIGVFSDITLQKEADAFIWRQANYDALTDLPNRQLFQERLEQALWRSDETALPVALLYLDLDDFKELNDSLGHAAGDLLLAEAAGRLRACVRETDTVARLGGDEFVFILGELADLAAVDRVAALAMERLAEPFMLEGEPVVISASMGITFYPIDGESSKDLMRNADLAMYGAKERGKRQTVRFMPSMLAHAMMRRELARDLVAALQEDQFELVYQPIIDLASGRIEKVECLIRWRHPHKGMISPGIFVPFAEDSGMINELGEWVFHEATRQVARWRAHHPRLQASINVSPVQFIGEGLSPARWLEHLDGLDMAGAHVVVEITERLLMEVDSDVSRKLIAFRDAGVQVALDDFGTGYSSMSYLKRFDIDYIKIDQSFIRNLAPGSEDRVLCEAMIAMAHRLGLQVVAEGVETVAQRDLLRAAGCDFAQGYLFSRPVSADRFEALLRDTTIAAAISSPHSSSTGEFPPRT